MPIHIRPNAAARPPLPAVAEALAGQGIRYVEVLAHALPLIESAFASRSARPLPSRLPFYGRFSQKLHSTGRLALLVAPCPLGSFTSRPILVTLP